MNYNYLDHFMAVSYLYFLMTDTNAATVSAAEREDLVLAINGDEAMAYDGGHYLV